MKKIISIAIGSLILIACNENKKVDDQARINNESAELKKIVDQKNAKLEKWYKEGVIDSVGSVMADSVVQMPPNSKPIYGKQNVIKYWSQLMQWGQWQFNFNAQQVRANGPLGVELGKYVMVFYPNTSAIPAVKDSGNYVVYWQKINGDWKVMWDAPVSSLPVAINPPNN